MMENAGRALATTARTMASDSDGSIVVVAGDGGNGGGGLCAARHLANNGDDVRVVLDRDPESLTGAAATQMEILGATDVPVGTDADAIESAGLLVDALVGYGLRGVLEGRAAYLVSAANRTGARTLSLDVPTGLDATTGERPGPSVDADRTLTLALPKTGLATGGVGDLSLADIGIPCGVYDRAGVKAYEQPFDGRNSIRLHVVADDAGGGGDAE
jgi:NAD(P)H-hydrate epimerase